MSCSVTLKSSHNQQEREEHPDQHPLKRQKLCQPAPAYWDTLSKIWLTKDALEELDRRNRAFSSTLAPHPLISCKPESLSKIKRLSRQGGPDLSDLRNFPDPYISCYQLMSTNSSGRQKRRAGTPLEGSNTNTKTTKTTSTSAYNRNFEQKLIDYGFYPKGYEYPDGRVPGKPNNWEEIIERLVQPRPSLSPSRFSEREFQIFEREDTNASKEKLVTTTVLPIINDGTLVNAKPDYFVGARPEQLKPEIRNELNNLSQSATTPKGVSPH
ncbi:hypothetical protein TMEN_6938 [Trichophyton mentagrophytes]|nr:hypothetical protein TMEN_6938 [Trichophyton mentagrophytes]